MKNQVKSWMLVLSLAFSVGAVSSWAQETPKSEKDKMLDKAKEKAKEELDKKFGDKSATPGQPSPEDMQKMMEAAKPGPQHEHFKELVGKWDVACTWTMPGAPAMHSTGTAEYKLILDGRFVVEDLSAVGVEDKQPFHGHGITGYDKDKGKYIGTWMDSMGTGMSTSEGTMDPSGKIMTSTMDTFDCMTKQPKKMKMTEEKVSEDKRVMKMYDMTGGTEVLMGEVTYTRKK